MVSKQHNVIKMIVIKTNTVIIGEDYLGKSCRLSGCLTERANDGDVVMR